MNHANLAVLSIVLFVTSTNAEAEMKQPPSVNPNSSTTSITSKSFELPSQAWATMPAKALKKQKPPSGVPGSVQVAPPQAASVGYMVNTFSGAFTTSNIDLRKKAKTGSTWYLWHFDEIPTDSNTLEINNDGTITFLGARGSRGLSTVAPTGKHAMFVGTAFGGGFYIEAALKFDPSTVVLSNGWPAFWSMPLEPIVSLNSVQWIGQPAGYVHLIEPDFFEYDVGHGDFYGGTIHELYGIKNETCPNLYCQFYAPYNRQVPANTDFRQYHRYGFLWVPATVKINGYADFYFDDQKVGAHISWSQFMDQPPPPTLSQPWAFGILDRLHLAVNIGTGVREPMTVRSVNVWQTSAAQNLTN